MGAGDDESKSCTRIICQGYSRSGHAVQNANEVGEIVNNGQVVLYDDDEVAGVQQRTNDAAEKV